MMRTVTKCSSLSREKNSMSKTDSERDEAEADRLHHIAANVAIQVLNHIGAPRGFIEAKAIRVYSNRFRVNLIADRDGNHVVADSRFVIANPSDGSLLRVSPKPNRKA